MNSSRRLLGVRSLAGAVGATVLAVGAFALIRGAGNTGRSPAPSTTPPTAATTVMPSASAAPESTTPRPTARAETVGVPNVVGLARDEAVSDLARAGLAARVQTLPSVGTPAGFVLSQSPLPGMEIGKGSTVALVVSG
jgi:hypothetical protein